jgi:hypothetical protein
MSGQRTADAQVRFTMSYLDWYPKFINEQAEKEKAAIKKQSAKDKREFWGFVIVAVSLVSSIVMSAYAIQLAQKSIQLQLQQQSKNTATLDSLAKK